MKYILAEDIPAFIPPIQEVIKTLGNGAQRSEYEAQVEVGDTAAIAHVKGYWVGDLIRIDIKFRR